MPGLLAGFKWKPSIFHCGELHGWTPKVWLCFFKNSPMNQASPFSIRPLTAVALAAICFFSPGQAAEPELKLKENDVWVMAGDSITAQRLHTNYIEAFYHARFPALHLHFRNSGIGGNRTSHLLQRFEYDVAAWKPTIVSVELGMNDVNNGENPAKYIDGIRELIVKIRAIPAQPVLISSSPVDDGSITGDWRSDRCRRLDLYTNALKKLAEEEKVVFVDQYHPLLDLWGNNRRKGAEAAAKSASPAGSAENPPAEVAPPLLPGLIALGGNPVHPGVVGQYTMAAAILLGLKAEGEVSSAVINADGTVVEAKNCSITDSTGKDGKLTFTRLDEAGCWPIVPAARNAATLMPGMLDLTRYMLKIPGLPDGRYRVTINGKRAAMMEARDLGAGWNITTAFDGLPGERSSALLSLLEKLQVKLNTDWRAASKDGDAGKLAAAQSAIEACEAEIYAAAKPVALHFELEKETR
ncbi:MAG: GDSL-like Lipase/Acylhydrolase [Chthoniobacteraceae bacterium]|nr:GDSL-like Lipase/Acylhydrolase [Chthoniobacteraceae bacterium]